MRYYGDESLLETIIALTGYAFAGFTKTDDVQTADLGPDLQIDWNVATGDIAFRGPDASQARFMGVLREVMTDRAMSRKSPVQRFRRAIDEEIEP